MVKVGEHITLDIIGTIGEYEPSFFEGLVHKFADKAKVTVQFRGREITHKERGSMLLERILEELGDEVNVESRPKMEGRSMIMLLGPKSKK